MFLDTIWSNALFPHKWMAARVNLIISCWHPLHLFQVLQKTNPLLWSIKADTILLCLLLLFTSKDPFLWVSSLRFFGLLSKVISGASSAYFLCLEWPLLPNQCFLWLDHTWNSEINVKSSLAWGCFCPWLKIPNDSALPQLQLHASVLLCFIIHSTVENYFFWSFGQ